MRVIISSLYYKPRTIWCCNVVYRNMWRLFHLRIVFVKVRYMMLLEMNLNILYMHYRLIWFYLRFYIIIPSNYSCIYIFLSIIMIYKQKKQFCFPPCDYFICFTCDYWNCLFLYLIYRYNNINYNNIYMSITITSIMINNN